MSQYIHDKWGAEQGFLGGTVYAICQSDDGYLWIGTERGLVRFDGFSFKLIQQPIPASPPIGAVRGLAADREGNLWVRLDGSQLLIYREGKFQDAFAHFGLRESAITAMAEDNDGGILLAGLSGRIFRYHHGQLSTMLGPGSGTSTVISLAETGDHRIWLGMQSDGLHYLSGGTLSNVSGELADKSVNALLPAYIGGLWVGAESGIRRWRDGEFTKPDLRPSMDRFQALAIIRDRDANLWVGTDRGLLRIAPSGDAVMWSTAGKLQKGVTAVYEDRDKNLWFGGPDGIERLQDGYFETYSIQEGLPSENNGPIYVDDEGKTWFAPPSGGLYWLRDHRVQRVDVSGLDKDVVYSISGGDGRVLVGRQHGGMTVLTKSGDSYSARTYTHADGLPQNSVYSVYQARDGSVWTGSVSGGVSRLKQGVLSNYSVIDGLASDSINAIFEGFDGTMWFATPDGLSSFANGQWINRSAQDGLPSSNVITVFEDSKHILWIGTSAGLALFTSGHISVPHNPPEPLHEQVFGITEDKRGELWIATSDHMLQVNRDKLLSGALGDSDIRSFGIADGLRGVNSVRRDRSLFTDRLGRVWISLVRGLAVANSQRMSGYTAPVFARIESMSVEGNPIGMDGALKLAAGSRSITINYASSVLSRPDQVRFRYKLDGSGQGWSVAVATRQVVYSNLGPRSYRFRILASSGDGLWNGPETVIAFFIQPKFWQTWWFETFCFATCVLVIVTVYRLRMYQVTRQLNIRFQDRLAERTHIAQELHDTLLQGVLSASLQLDLAEEQLPDESPAKPLLHRVLQLMRTVTEEGRNTLRGLRVPNIDHGDLERAFSRLRQEYFLDDKIEYRIVVNSTSRPLRPVVRDEVYRIVREALVNSFLHARAKSIEVELEYASRYLKVLVRDDGVGIDPQVLHAGREGHWGLPGMRERSESIGASLKLRSRIGAGTEVELTVPGTIAFDGKPGGPTSRWTSWLSREKFEAGAKGKTKDD
jgi:signal transduction histidine kinase/ligand-binding sensor domain-containing protein